MAAVAGVAAPDTMMTMPTTAEDDMTTENIDGGETRTRTQGSTHHFMMTMLTPSLQERVDEDDLVLALAYLPLKETDTSGSLVDVERSCFQTELARSAAFDFETAVHLQIGTPTEMEMRTWDLMRANQEPNAGTQGKEATLRLHVATVTINPLA